MDLLPVVFRFLLALLGVDGGVGSVVPDVIEGRDVQALRTIVVVVAGTGRFECLPEIPDERQPERLPCEDLRIAQGSPRWR